MSDGTLGAKNIGLSLFDGAFGAKNIGLNQFDGTFGAKNISLVLFDGTFRAKNIGLSLFDCTFGAKNISISCSTALSELRIWALAYYGSKNIGERGEVRESFNTPQPKSHTNPTQRPS